MRKSKKQIEKTLVREFLEKILGLPIRRLLAGRESRPDVYAVIETNGEEAVVEIELTEYQVDAPHDEGGGSPGERLRSTWAAVQDSICLRLRKKRIEVEVGVSLKYPYVVHKNDARELAEELVRMARVFEATASPPASLGSFGPEYPLLSRYVHALKMKRVGFYSCHWTCCQASAANVGLIRSAPVVARQLGALGLHLLRPPGKIQKCKRPCNPRLSIVYSSATCRAGGIRR
jgi:hypothetical protein